MADKSDTCKILIVDDEQLVHDALKLNLKKLDCCGQSLEFLDAYTSEEAKKIVDKEPEVVVIILDVMMEENDSGLNFIRYLRETLLNTTTKILLHTGQSKVIPKLDVPDYYMIDGYLDKNNIDNEDCHVAIKLAIKSHQEHVKMIEKMRPTDENLFSDIAETYKEIIENYDFLEKHEELMARINRISYLTKELLYSYTLTDLKGNLPVGTTKTQRLSSEDYSALIAIDNIKLICQYTPQEQHEEESEIIHLTLVRAIKKFSEIESLSGKIKNRMTDLLSKVDVEENT